MIHFILFHIEQKIITKAAKIQEQFDLNIYNLEWNKISIWNKLSYEYISEAKNKYIWNINELKNWYSDVSTLPIWFAIIICQRSNLFWDLKLRKYFSYTIILLMILIFLIHFSISYFLNIWASLFVYWFLLSSFPAIIIWINEVKENYEIINSKRELENIILKLIDNKPNEPSFKDLRNIQDKIYELRKKWALIPEFWYNFFKEKFENNMINGNEYYKKILLEK